MLRPIRSATLLAAMLVAFVGCGGNGDDGGNGGPTGPSGPSDGQVDGPWTYETDVQNRLTGMLDGATLVCAIGGVSMTLSQSGATFSGSTSGGGLNCSEDGDQIMTAEPLQAGSVINGSVSGDDVSFEFEFDTDMGHQASVSHQGGFPGVVSMAGTATATLQLADGRVFTLNGEWVAVPGHLAP